MLAFTIGPTAKYMSTAVLCGLYHHHSYRSIATLLYIILLITTMVRDLLLY